MNDVRYPIGEFSPPDGITDAHRERWIEKIAEAPAAFPYDETLWAELSDSRTLAPDVSLTLLEALHERWVALRRSLRSEDFQRTFRHPEFGRAFTPENVLARNAWHGRHHAAHITSPREPQRL